MTKILTFNHSYFIKGANALPQQTISLSHLSKNQGWVSNPGQSLGVKEKTLPAEDEDSLTLAWQAATHVVRGFEKKIGALYFGSESPPYAVKPAVTLLTNFLNLDSSLFGANLEFACRAGLEAVVIIGQFLEAKNIDYGLAIGADTAQAKSGDILSLTAAAGASAWLLGRKPQKESLKLLAASSFVTDTPDFYRHRYQPYPRHGGRFTGAPAYFTHLETAYNSLMDSLQLSPDQIAKVAIHAPNTKFPLRLAKKLGFSQQQISPLLGDHLGNPYTASVMIQGVEKAKQLKSGDKLLLLSFGSGAGGLALLMEKI